MRRWTPPPVPIQTWSVPSELRSTKIVLTVLDSDGSKILGLTKSSALFLSKIHHGPPIELEASLVFQAIRPESVPIRSNGNLPSIEACAMDNIVALESEISVDNSVTSTGSGNRLGADGSAKIVHLRALSLPVIRTMRSSESEINSTMILTVPISWVIIDSIIGTPSVSLTRCNPRFVPSSKNLDSSTTIDSMTFISMPFSSSKFTEVNLNGSTMEIPYLVPTNSRS